MRHTIRPIPLPCLTLIASATIALGACAADTADLSPEELGPDAEVGASGQALASGTLRLNDVYYVPKREDVIDAPMYSTGTGTTVVRRIRRWSAVKVVIAEPSSSGRYRVDHSGTLGWMNGVDLTLHHRYDSALSSTRIDALARARKAMGFSYWWSNARWPSTGATTWPRDNRGKCSGVCGKSVPCEHVATGGAEEYGSDCSGFVSTIWGFDDFDSDTNDENNGFGTLAFNEDTAKWKTVELADAKAGDAVVRHDSVKKHVFLIASKRDSKSRFNTYECAGCDEGCRTKRRTIEDGDAWHAIRRTGW